MILLKKYWIGFNAILQGFVLSLSKYIPAFSVGSL